MNQLNMISLQKTKHSQFCKDIFESGKAINIAHNDYFLARELINQSHSEEDRKKATDNISHLKSFLSSHKLKLVHFAFGFNKSKDTYNFQYVISSKIHKTDDFQVEGFLPNLENVIFVMFPQMFATSFNEVFKNIPFDILLQVSNGE